jgi:hypothetical protein
MASVVIVLYNAQGIALACPQYGGFGCANSALRLRRQALSANFNPASAARKLGWRAPRYRRQFNCLHMK